MTGEVIFRLVCLFIQAIAIMVAIYYVYRAEQDSRKFKKERDKFWETYHKNKGKE